MNTMLKYVEAMLHSPIHNYIVPGLTSWLVGYPGPKGVVRMFHMTRDQNVLVTPHSHRYDLACHVMAGSVENTIYTNVPAVSNASMYCEADQEYGSEPGSYKLIAGPSGKFMQTTTLYEVGQTYSMGFNIIHSIKFNLGAKVLIFEGRNLTDTSTILEPMVDGKVIPLHRTEDWMFKP